MAPVKQEPEQTDQDANRRRHERVRVKQPVKLEATLHGRFIDIMRLEMSGVTIDLSNGGMSATVDQSISPGVRCRVEFPNPDGGSPLNLWGRVRRTTPKHNVHVVALEFEELEEAAEVLRGISVETAVLEVPEGDTA